MQMLLVKFHEQARVAQTSTGVYTLMEQSKHHTGDGVALSTLKVQVVAAF